MCVRVAGERERERERGKGDTKDGLNYGITCR